MCASPAIRCCKPCKALSPERTSRNTYVSRHHEQPVDSVEAVQFLTTEQGASAETHTQPSVLPWSCPRILPGLHVCAPVDETSRSLRHDGSQAHQGEDAEKQ